MIALVHVHAASVHGHFSHVRMFHFVCLVLWYIIGLQQNANALSSWQVQLGILSTFLTPSPTMIH